MRMDLHWWHKFLPGFNGVTLAWMYEVPNPDSCTSCNASIMGVRGYFEEAQYFHLGVPQEWVGTNIAYLEMWGVVIALQVWGMRLTGKRIHVACDNESVVVVLSYGRSRDLFLQAGMREVAFLLATHEMEMKIHYVWSRENFVADWLSRWRTPVTQSAFRRFTHEKSLRRVIARNPFKFTHNW